MSLSYDALIRAGKVHNPSDGGCAASQRTDDWPAWIEMVFTSRAEAEQAHGLNEDDGH